MESLRGPLLNVVLKIREGKGFAFLKSPINITANLNGNALESDTIPCSPSPILESTFVWEAEKAVLRRMRSSNTSLRIELFTQEASKKRNRIGYILINFKQAQIVKTGPAPSLIENWCRLLGVKVEAKNHNPEILLSLFIKDADFNIDPSPRKPKKSSEAATKGSQRSADKEQGYIQVGPQSAPCQIFIFTVQIRSAVNLNSLLAGGGDEKLVIEFTAFSTCYTTGNMAQVNGDISGESLVLSLRSTLAILSTYFTEYPVLQFHLIHAKTPIASTSLQLQSSLPGQEDWSAALASNKGSAVLHKDSRLYFGSDGTGNSHAFIDVSVSLQIQAKSADQHLVKPFTITQSPRKPKLEAKKKVEISKSCVSGLEIMEGRDGSGDGILAGSVLSFNTRDKTSCSAHDILETVVLLAENEPRQWEKSATQVAPSTLPSAQAPLNTDAVSGNSLAVQEMTKKVVEELEDWKEKQQILYKAELKKKLDREIRRLTEEWVSRQSELEDVMRTKVEESCSLTQQLHRTAADLQARLTAASKTQQQLDERKAELEKKYSVKLEQLREASKRHQLDTQLMVSQLRMEKEELEARLCGAQRENDRLKGMTGGLVTSTPPSPLDQLTDHQATSLLLDLKGMEEKLSAALESKEFFRKEWGRALREIHKMKSEQEIAMRQQLEAQRYQLESLRMVSLIEDNAKEKEQDLFSIKDLRSQIEQLNSARSTS